MGCFILPQKHSRFIGELRQVVERYTPTPQVYNYVVKRVRNLLGLTMPKRPKKLPEVMTDAEIFTFLQKADSFSPMHSILANLLLFTGIRINEARNLDTRDIDFNGNQIKIVAGKGNKDRFVPLPPGLGTKIKLYISKQSPGYLLQKKGGKPITKRRLQQIVTQIIKSCEFHKPLHTHSLRHTYATVLLRRGLRKEDVQVILGHSSIKTTEVYTRLELGDIKDNVLRLMGYG